MSEKNSFLGVYPANTPYFVQTRNFSAQCKPCLLYTSGCFKHLEEATGEEAEWIDRYQILQYNNMFDKKKQSKVFFPYLQN